MMNQPFYVPCPCCSTNVPVYDVAAAAEYLGMTVDALKYHIHGAETISTRRLGRLLVFTQDELDRFKREKRPQGRPPKPKE